MSVKPRKPKTAATTEVHTFRKGQKLHLDSIYNIQGLGTESGGWWKHDSYSTQGTPGDDITITRDITITITVSYP